MDGGMKIELEKEDWPDVFDDPEFCENKNGECRKLFCDENKRFCGVFDDGAIYDFKSQKNTVRIRKCNKCKSYYNKAKQKRDECFSTPNTQ